MSELFAAPTLMPTASHFRVDEHIQLLPDIEVGLVWFDGVDDFQNACVNPFCVLTCKRLLRDDERFHAHGPEA